MKKLGRLAALSALALTAGVAAGPAAGAVRAIGATPGADPPALALAFDDPALPARAHDVGPGGRLRIAGVAIPSVGEAPVTLDLVRFRVFAPGARLDVHGAAGERTEPPPTTAYFRGTIAGEPGSLAVVAVGAGGPRGAVRGLLVAGGRTWEIGPAGPGDGPDGAASAAPWTLRPAAPVGEAAGGPTGAAAPAADTCAADELPDLAAEAADPGLPTAGATALPRPQLLGGPYQAAEVAVETDWELFQKLGSAAAIADYVGDLFAVLSAVYLRDVDTAFQVTFLSVWETSVDPFTVPSGLLDALLEVGDYWHAVHLDVPRTLVHFLSGKSGLTGGIAFHGVLCSPDLPFQGHWGGGYSLAGALTDFGFFRDTFIMSHEIGHNFRSHHTHCYNDLPDPGDPPVDHCSSGEIRNDGNPCYAGPTSLPPDGGSIMSYCHLLPGGYGNITLAFGEEGRWGEHSERVVQRMVAHVQSVGCLVPLDGLVFTDGFETGDTSAWSAAVP